MRPELAHRPAASDATLRLLVLAAAEDGCVAVDLGSGALVRAAHPAGRPLSTFAVATAPVADSLAADHSRPESVRLAAPPRPCGRLSARRAERWLRPLLHPPSAALLGFVGRSVPYWTLAGDRPSVTVVEPTAGPEVTPSASGGQCHFVWAGLRHELPLAHSRLARALARGWWSALSASDLERVLGYRPARLVVALTPPLEGYCYKVVAGFLPR